MKIYPDTRNNRVIFASRAEEQVYERCMNSLSEDWYCYYSCSLSTLEKDEGLLDNEIDFVLYHPSYGIFVIEVKGGQIKFDSQDRKFYSINRHNESFLIKDPFKQVLVWKSRFLRYLKGKGVKAPITHLVCFPSVEASKFPETASIVPKIIIGREEIKDIESFLKNIAKESHPQHFLNFNDVSKELYQILIGSTFTSRLYIRDYIDSHELRVQDIEAIYDSLVTPIVSSKRLGIEGEAGTGKTMLALLVAKHFRDLSKKVLLLSSNPILNLFLQQKVGEGIAVNTYAGVAEDFGVNLLNPPHEYKGSRNDWIQIDGPVHFKESINQKTDIRFDVIICDEAQDVQPFWWEGFEDLLKEKEGHLYLFFDRSQGIFGSGSNEHRFEPDKTLPIPAPFFPLVNNYRTTREIAGFARPFRTGGNVLQSHCGRLGYVPEIIVYKDKEECQRILGKLFRKLIRDEKLKPEELTLLSARDPQKPESLIYNTSEMAKIPLHQLSYMKKRKWRQTKSPRGHVSVATISSFKGLETKVGILLNISEYNLPLSNPIMASLVYVACTRAKHMLYVCVQKDDPKREIIEKALSDVKAKGAMVLEGSEKDFEFIGTVSHYNPDRIGWLTVEDPAFQKSSIMFFPYDVKKAGINLSIKVGMKVKFRHKLEGHISIACNLKLVQN